MTVGHVSAAQNDKRQSKPILPAALFFFFVLANLHSNSALLCSIKYKDTVTDGDQGDERCGENGLTKLWEHKCIKPSKG